MSHRPAQLDLSALLALRHLEWRVRAIMEGVPVGLHRSPFAGSSVEFSEYRPYTNGDDIRHLDWRVLARSDRYYLRKHEEETNLLAWLVVDASRSMQFGSIEGVTKSEYANTLVATLAWFLHEQRDIPGLARFHRGLADVIPPRTRPGHLRRILATLEQPADGADTDLGASIRALARLARRRSLVIVVSDFLTPEESWSGPMAELAMAGHDVRALQILDPAEPALESLAHAMRWEDLETGRSLYVDPTRSRPSYRQKFSAHADAVRSACERAAVPLMTVLTNQPLDRVLLSFLRQRPPLGRLRGLHGR